MLFFYLHGLGLDKFIIFHTNKFKSASTPLTMLSSNKRVSNEKNKLQSQAYFVSVLWI